jgi:hypothetical protein
MTARSKQTGDRCNRCKTLHFFATDISSYSENESGVDFVSEFATSNSVAEFFVTFSAFLRGFQVNWRIFSKPYSQ